MVRFYINTWKQKYHKDKKKLNIFNVPLYIYIKRSAFINCYFSLSPNFNQWKLDINSNAFNNNQNKNDKIWTKNLSDYGCGKRWSTFLWHFPQFCDQNNAVGWLLSISRLPLWRQGLKPTVFQQGWHWYIKVFLWGTFFTCSDWVAGWCHLHVGTPHPVTCQQAKDL